MCLEIVGLQMSSEFLSLMKTCMSFYQVLNKQGAEVSEVETSLHYWFVLFNF